MFEPDQTEKLILDRLEKRLKLTAEQLRKNLKIDAIFCLCTTYWLHAFMQVVCDLVSSKDGTLLGPKRNKNDKQFVQVITTNPDLVWAAKWRDPRLGPRAINLTCQTVFQQLYGYDIEFQQYGKPTKATYDFAERHLRARAKRDEVEISNFYMIGDNPKSDIAGGNAMGWVTILVKTGVFDEKAMTSSCGNDKENPASYVVKDFEEAIKLICKLENIQFSK